MDLALKKLTYINLYFKAFCYGVGCL